MTADTPTILATSGGLTRGRRTLYGFAPLLHHAIELSGVSGRAPRVGFAGTALGDQDFWTAEFTAAGRAAGVVVSPINVFPMPNADDMAGLILDQDVVWVNGGSVANLLALWRLHGLDDVFRRAWESGVVLGGVSAGSLCWHVGGTTDSFGPTLQPVTNGLAFLPWSNSPHHDAEEQRRPLIHRLIAEGTLPDGYATENGTGLVFFGTELQDAFTEVAGKRAYSLTQQGGETREAALETRLL